MIVRLVVNGRVNEVLNELMKKIQRGEREEVAVELELSLVIQSVAASPLKRRGGRSNDYQVVSLISDKSQDASNEPTGTEAQSFYIARYSTNTGFFKHHQWDVYIVSLDVYRCL